MSLSRMPRYDVRNDGIGPYAVFYCEKCDREHRSTPDVAGNIAQDLGKQALGGLVRNVPLFGRAVADNITGQDPRYVYSLTPQQLDAAWKQVQVNFRECPTCKLVVCLSDFDTQSGYCNDDSPRRNDIARGEAEQAGHVIKGLADAFGLGGAIKNATDAAQKATAQMARCPKDGTLAKPGTKFCPECGSPMTQPVSAKCSKCGADTQGAKFCPECGAKVEVPAATAPANCKNCGAALGGAKFCPECGTRAA